MTHSTVSTNAQGRPEQGRGTTGAQGHLEWNRKMKEQILQALKKVKDLELGINVVDLGLIYEVKEAEGKIVIAMSPTTPFCPYLPQMLEQIKKAARGVPGVQKVEVSVVWVPSWNPQRMSPAARAELGIL